MGQINYKLCRILKKVSKKSGKEYCYAHLNVFTPDDTDILKIWITEEQYNALSKVPKDFDINPYVSVSYNVYNRDYEPKLTY